MVVDQALQRRILLVVLLNAFTTPLMLSAANVALPAIALDLSLNAVEIGWVPMAYLMAATMFTLIFGRLSDIYGYKSIFLSGVIFVVLTSLMGSIAIESKGLLIARFLQGVSAAMLYATQVAMISSAYPPASRGTAIGRMTSMIYLGLTCGPVLGGIVLDSLGWRWVFMFHIPLAFCALVAGLCYLPSEVQSTQGKQSYFDKQGAFLYSTTITLLCIALSFASSFFFLGLLLAFIGSAVLFIWHTLRSANPLIELRLFYTNRVFAFSSLASLIIYTATYSNVVLISLYLQYIHSLSATTSGLIMMVQPLTMALISPISGRLSDKTSPGLLSSLGMLTTLSGVALLASLSEQSSIWQVVIFLMLTGLGVSLFSTPNTHTIMSTVNRRQYGSISASISTMRLLGQTASITLITAIFSLVIGSIRITPDVYEVLSQAISISFTVAGLLCVLGVFCTWFSRKN